MSGNKAIVLLSGGLDSATTLGIAKAEGYTIYALSFSYGQRHDRELKSARELVKYYGIQHYEIIDLNLKNISASALTDDTKAIPENRLTTELSTEIPTTYVPARNLIMLSCAIAWAESIGAEAVFIGVNAIDYSGYPDCRPEFISAFEQVAALGTKTGTEGNSITVKTPLINLSKSEIITRGHELGVPFNLTWSCYKGGSSACGVCDSCQLRLNGFEDAGLEDTIEYENVSK
jgi:7-cyano-7-deazaguanine synthase